MYLPIKRLRTYLFLGVCLAAIACGGGSGDEAATCDQSVCADSEAFGHTTSVPHSHGDGHGGFTPGEVGEDAAESVENIKSDVEENTSEAAAPAVGDVIVHELIDPHTGATSIATLESGTCLPVTTPREFVPLLRESFGENGRCAATSPFWDVVLGSLDSFDGNCRLVYPLVRNADEQENAKVETNPGLLELSGLGLQDHLRVEWTEHFATGYEFPAGSQKLARFFISSAAGHQGNLMILDGGRLVQGTVFLQGTTPAGMPALFESVAYLEYTDGVPVGRDIAASLEVKIPSSEQAGWLEFSFDGQVVRQAIPRLQQSNQPCVTGFDGVWVGGNWSNRGTPSTRESRRYIDDIVIYGQQAR
ncbi:MAG: hypothetical protein KDD69_13225 [Bdellovibrionales bacterium]|nr:hypothetical protein [Bdellovibrionales bacterium]